MGLCVNSRPKRKSVVRDERIRRAMLGMTCNPPYSIQRFLDEVSAPDDGEEVFQLYGTKTSTFLFTQTLNT